MKPIRRKIRSHFGLTAKQVAVRSHRPWYFRWLASFAFIAVGFLITYFMMHDGNAEKLHLKMQQLEQDNKVLQTKMINAQRDLQVELATNISLAQELSSVQDENLKAKQELVFYKNMVEKNTK
jgi:hypothetical protein